MVFLTQKNEAMKKNNLMAVIPFMTTLFFMSCTQDQPPVPINEEEAITTLIYTLTPDDGGDPSVFSFKDLDGDGGDEPIIEIDTLEANKMYTGMLTLLYEAKTPAKDITEDITEEIKKESNDHQIFYQATAGLSIAYTDKDMNGKPLGLATLLTTKGPQKGELKITLRHEPNKSASGVANGNIANAGGSTDIEVIFNVNVE